MPLLLRVRTLVFFAVIFNAFCVFTKDLYAPVELPISDVQAVSILAAVLSLTTVIELVNKMSVAGPAGRSSPDIVVAAAVITSKMPGPYTAEPRTEPEPAQKAKEEEEEVRQPTSDRQQIRPGSKELPSSEKKRQRSYYEREEEAAESYASSGAIRPAATLPSTRESDLGSAAATSSSGEAKSAEGESRSKGSRMPMPPTMLPRARGRESDPDVPTRRSRSLPRSTGDARADAKGARTRTESGRSDEMWMENVTAAISERKSSDAGSTTASEKQRMGSVKRRVSRSMSRLLGRRKSSTAETSGYAGGEEKSLVSASERPAAPSSVVGSDKILPKEGSSLEPETAQPSDEGELAPKPSGGTSAITVQAGRLSRPVDGVEKPASQVTAEENNCVERKTLKKTETRKPDDPVFFLDERKITLQFIPRACRTEPDQAAQQPEYAEGEEVSQKGLVDRLQDKLEETDEQIMAVVEKIRNGKLVAPTAEEEEEEEEEVETTEQRVQEAVAPAESAFTDQRRRLAIMTVKLAKTLLCLASLLLQLVIVIAYVLPCLCDILSDRMLGNLVGIFIVVFATMYKCGGHVLGGYNIC